MLLSFPKTALKTCVCFPELSREDVNPDLKGMKGCGHKTASNSPSPQLPCVLYVSNHHNLHRTLLNSILTQLMQEPSLQVPDLISRNPESCAMKKDFRGANEQLRKHQVCWPQSPESTISLHQAHFPGNDHCSWHLMRERAQD